ncbi:hypothetical protein K1T71_008794 [Dendrolimus kikuchii]|uniref:Uncharacterized protein n=1 Tax=Dendrolimus kikuchii TaxID=765133 RepID=A0ACC1CVH2_9NEOP|nr:hypothetical protein K1T71_008794 [Dendrolimus kikuchii]
MRALAAILTLALCSCRLHASEPRSPYDLLSRKIRSLLDHSKNHPVARLVNCGKHLGPTKCLSALSVWRAEKALTSLATGTTSQFNLTEDVEQFPWNQYSNSSEEQLYSQLCDDTEKLLEQRPMSLTMIPGYTFQLTSNGNGKLNVDVFRKNETEESQGRGSMKKMKKSFYKILPFLMVPGLIMSAILPFVLPALKMMVVGVGILNNMALSGAVFTLLRNNAFSDRYDKKVIYVNAGYKNEKHSTIQYKNPTHDNYDTHYSDFTHHSDHDEHTFGEDLETIEEVPANSDWLKQYYYGNDYRHIKDLGYQVERRSEQQEEVRTKNKKELSKIKPANHREESDRS